MLDKRLIIYHFQTIPASLELKKTLLRAAGVELLTFFISCFFFYFHLFFDLYPNVDVSSAWKKVSFLCPFSS